MIPRVIHQTYKSEVLPSAFVEWVARLKRHHPSWSYRFYTDVDCRKVLEGRFPSLLPVYDRYQLAVQRADLFRIAIVYLEGGFYADLDMECHEALDPLCRYEAVFAQEKILTTADAETLRIVPMRIANYMFGSVAGHPFLKRLLAGAIERSSRRIQTENDVLESCGPGLVSASYDEYVREPALAPIHLLGSGSRDCQICVAPSCQFGDYASHWHVGSWRFERPRASTTKQS